MIVSVIDKSTAVRINWKPFHYPEGSIHFSVGLHRSLEVVFVHERLIATVLKTRGLTEGLRN